MFPIIDLVRTEPQSNLVVGSLHCSDPRIRFVDRYGGGRGDSLFVNVPFSVGRGKIFFTGEIVCEMSVKAGNPPSLIGIRVGDGGVPGSLAVGTVPCHLSVPVAYSRQGARL